MGLFSCIRDYLWYNRERKSITESIRDTLSQLNAALVCKWGQTRQDKRRLSPHPRRSGKAPEKVSSKAGRSNSTPRDHNKAKTSAFGGLAMAVLACWATDTGRKRKGADAPYNNESEVKPWRAAIRIWYRWARADPSFWDRTRPTQQSTETHRD